MALAEKLIVLVKKYPVLYDLSHEDYKNIRKKDKVWEEIGAELNQDPDDVKKKWKNLRDTFLRYIKGKRAKTGKKWHWAGLMETFNPSLTFESKTPNNTIELPYECSQVSLTENSNLDPISTECVETSFNNSVFVGFPQTSEPASPLESKLHLKPNLSKKKKLKNEFRLTSSVESLIKYLKSHEQPEMDEIDLLFLAYARNVKTLSKKRQAIAKMKVSQVIMEQEIKNLEDELPTNDNFIIPNRSMVCSPTIVSRSGQNSPSHEDTKLLHEV